MKIVCQMMMILLGTVIQSCKETSEETNSTAQTQSGSLSYIEDGTQTVQLNNQYAEYFLDTLGDYFTFQVFTGSKTNTGQKEISMSLYNINQPGNYSIGANNPVRLIKPIAGKESWVYLAYSGTMHITRLDTINHVWSGTFAANLSLESIAMQESWETKPEVKDSISIASGWFDLPLNKWSN
jgi:hypothetical protein